VLAFTGCLSEKATAPAIRSPSTTIGTVAVSPYNVVMAVGGTVQLTVTGESLTGVPIASFDSVEYLLQNVTDTLRVRVSPTGLVTALSATSSATPVTINVLPFKDGLTKADQVILYVTDAVIPGLTLSIQPIAPDSARLAQSSAKFIAPVLANPVTGASIDDLRIRYTVTRDDAPKILVYQVVNVSTPTIDGQQTSQMSSDICCGALNAIVAKGHTGTPWIHADIDVYGTLLRDSVQYTLTPPFNVQISFSKGNFKVGTGNDGGVIYLARTGTLTVANFIDGALDLPVTLTFDHPELIQATTPPATDGGSSGDVVNLPSGFKNTTRTFPVAGTYHWNAVIGGVLPPFSGQKASGTIVVSD